MLKNNGKVSEIKKYDKIGVGLILSLLVTIISFFIFYLFNHTAFHSLNRFISYFRLTGFFSSILSLCAIPNLLVFFIFIQTNRYKSARGVVVFTMIMALIVAYLRIF